MKCTHKDAKRPNRHATVHAGDRQNSPPPPFQSTHSYFRHSPSKRGNLVSQSTADCEQQVRGLLRKAGNTTQQQERQLIRREERATVKRTDTAQKASNRQSGSKGGGLTFYVRLSLKWVCLFSTGGTVLSKKRHFLYMLAFRERSTK